MKKWFLVLPLLLFGVVSLNAQSVTYVQTNNVNAEGKVPACILIGCTDAVLSPLATLSYGTGLFGTTGTFQNKTAVFNGVTYTDFHGETRFLGKGYPPQPTWGTYLTTGYFFLDLYYVSEEFQCFKTCGNYAWVAGSVLYSAK